MQTTTTTKGWQVLEEPAFSYMPKDATVLLSRGSKGNPALHFNSRAVLLMGVQAGDRVQLLAFPAGGLTLGVRSVEDGGNELKLDGTRKTTALRFSTGALAHLAAYKRIQYRVRAGKTGEPEWVLEAVTSERVET